MRDVRSGASPAARRRRQVAAAAWLAVPLLLIAAAVAFSVDVQYPRVAVRWLAQSPPGETLALLGLAAPRRSGGDAADSFLLINPDEGALEALRRRPDIQRVDLVDADAPPSLASRLRVERVPSYAWLIEWQAQSTALLLIAVVLLAGSTASGTSIRAVAAGVALVLLTGACFALPLDAGIHMGDAGQYTASRAGFENVFPRDSVGFESHLSSRLLWWLDQRLGGDAASPAAAMAVLARLATWWYLAMLVVAGAVGRFSAATLRYLSLAIAAPASLMFFGYRELGYLSLTPAAVPLVLHGLRGAPGRLEAGAVSAGLGAALHGFGLLSVLGAAAAAVARAGRLRERAGLAARVVAFATAAYLAWIFLYVVGLELTVIPSDAGELPWRPLAVSEVRGTYVSWAVLSARGAVEMIAAFWMVGAPLAVAAAAARRHSAEAAACLVFSIPSLIFLAALWPIQGLAVEADLLVAAFPAVYALAWLAAQTWRTTVLGLLLVASSHVVFWRILFSDAFVASRM